MRYDNVITGTFLERPNRFIAVVDINGRKERCHVKNTGRCKEILVPGVKAVLSGPFEGRKTEYDLIAVYKNDMLINIDSQAPNKAFREFLISRFPDAMIRPEFTHGGSRFDFLMETNGKKILIEVKGVTLEDDGMTLFPDAPTERGLKHVRELTEAVKNGFDAYVVFVIQMKGITGFTPNRRMHREFADALLEADENGVNIIAYDCIVEEDSMIIDQRVLITF